MTKKIEPNLKAVVDYVIGNVDFEVDDDPMSKLINAKLLEASAKMHQSEQQILYAKKFNELIAAIERIERNQINEATQIMHQALLVMAAIVPEDNKDDIMQLAKQMASAKTEIHTGDRNKNTNIDTVHGDAAGEMNKS